MTSPSPASLEQARAFLASVRVTPGRVVIPEDVDRLAAEYDRVRAENVAAFHEAVALIETMVGAEGEGLEWPKEFWDRVWKFVMAHGGTENEKARLEALTGKATP